MPKGKPYYGPRSKAARVLKGKRGIRSDQFRVVQGTRTIRWHRKKTEAERQAKAINRVRSRRKQRSTVSSAEAERRAKRRAKAINKLREKRKQRRG